MEMRKKGCSSSPDIGSPFEAYTLSYLFIPRKVFILNHKIVLSQNNPYQVTISSKRENLKKSVKCVQNTWKRDQLHLS